MRPERAAFALVVTVGLIGGAVLFPRQAWPGEADSVRPDRLAFTVIDPEPDGRSSGFFALVGTVADRSAPDRSATERSDGTEQVSLEATSTTVLPTTSTTTTTASSTTGSVPTTSVNHTPAPSNDAAAGPPEVGSSNTTDGPAMTTPPPEATGSNSTGPASNSVTVYRNDFASGTLDVGNWYLYDSPGHAGWGLRRPSAISVESEPDATGGHVLQITAAMGTGDEAGRQVSGGMALAAARQRYGRYSVRVRVDADPDQVTSGVVLLWPDSERWPDDGEINIFEGWDNRSTRSPVESNLHWVDGAGTHQQSGLTHPVAGTDWHVYTLEWRPDRLTVQVDGGEPQLLATDPATIPDSSMHLTVQLDNFDAPDRPGQQPTLSGPVRLQVDWIRIEALPETIAADG